jgi:phosphate ABC transporter phosphate-binding protein
MEKLRRGRPGRGRLLIVVAVLVIAVALIAVAVYAGWLFPSSGPKAKIATFPCPLITKWSSEYANVTKAATTPGPQVTVNYNCVGSGAGITQITQKTVDFAGSDAPLKPSERAAAPNLLHIPETIGAVTAAYNVAELSSGIKLSGYTLAEIFLGKITMWNSPNISADNTGITLPARAIQVVHRSDSSGTTFVFTSYLNRANPGWNASLVGKAPNWPVGIGAQGNSGVAGKIQTTPDSIGYVELAYTVQNNMKVAQIKNHDGQWVTPSLATTAAAAMAFATPPPPDGDWGTVSILNQSGASSYPIASLTYLLVYKELNVLTSLNQTKAQALVDFLWWAIHGGQDLSEALTFPKLSAGLVTVDETAIRSITFNGQTLHS